jgi:hypothetical protein
MASTFCMSNAPDSVYKDRKQVKKTNAKVPALSWQGSSGLTLANLYGLASSLNPGDKELTPVQAWFELASQYHHNLLLDPAVLESLKREFVGVVKCVHFGALMERSAFESVVGRVIGQYAFAASPPFAI